MIVHAAESLYWFNTTEPPYLIKGLPISLESRHTTSIDRWNAGISTSPCGPVFYMIIRLADLTPISARVFECG